MGIWLLWTAMLEDANRFGVQEMLRLPAFEYDSPFHARSHGKTTGVIAGRDGYFSTVQKIREVISC